MMIAKDHREVEHTYMQGKVVNPDGFEALLTSVYDTTKSNAQDYSLLMSESSLSGS